MSGVHHLLREHVNNSESGLGFFQKSEPTPEKDGEP